MKILLVEDHDAVRRMVAAHLRRRGFAVDSVARGDEAVAASASASARYDAVILDLGLPDMDGMEVLKVLRQGAAAGVPALILSARDRLDDRIDGLDAGADDYIVKPFDLSELEARLRAVLRRAGAPPSPRRFEYGDLMFEPTSCSAAVGGERLELTRREALAFEELVRAAGRPVVKDGLEDRLYGLDETVSGNALEAVISRLRRRLTAAGSAVWIESLRGIGYRLRTGGRRP